MLFKQVHQVPKSAFIKYCTSNKANNKLYSKTVLLPKTAFPLRLDGKKLIERDEALNKSPAFEKLYNWQREKLKEPEFVLHDGPPYANGVPHIGHAINRILKDTILRCKILNGQKVHFVPGWDCHGLPIELKALSKFVNLTPLDIRTKAKSFAEETISKQKEVFQSWGLVGDWNNPYKTFTKDFVKNELRLFYDLYRKKLIYRDVKPIYWSPSSKTALAEAELEYNEKHESVSTYVRFKINNIPALPSLNDKQVYALVWTTTPWTLPSNQAICYNENLSYCLIKRDNPDDMDIYIIAADLMDDFTKTTKFNTLLLGVLNGEDLKDTTYQHIFYKDQICKFYNASHVSSSKGTGLVHTAPAHGPDDFLIALQNNLKITDLVDDRGCYNTKAGPQLTGKFVLNQGTEEVLKIIKDDIINIQPFVHSYPYDWRTKKPVIIRASQQWFVNTNSIKDKAAEALEKVDVIPKSSGSNYKTNLIKQLMKRPYWCISRQRKWGVPIPVLYEKSSQNIIINDVLIEHYCNLIDKSGTDFWWQLPLDALLPSHIRNEYDVNAIEKSDDILDIWFDSGVTWSYALNNDQVADLYLEGVDQFTGWFQSSLMTSVAVRNKAPYKSIYVHGFAVDEKGNKMSKSVGNVVDPVGVTNGSKNNKPFGIDTLRWWVACHANSDSLAFVGNNVLQASADEVQKIRAVLRFALSSLHDFSEKDERKLLLMDRYVLHMLYKFYYESKEALDDYQFNRINKNVINLLTNTVSALYYPSIKDRLYCEIETSAARKGAQYVLLQVFNIVTQMIAPIVPHLVEEMHLHLPQRSSESYFTQRHLPPQDWWSNEHIRQIGDIVLDIRRDVNVQVGATTNNLIVNIGLSEDCRNLINREIPIDSFGQELVDLLQVSSVTINNEENVKENYKFTINKSLQFSCPRCRRINSEVENELCVRCNDVVNKSENKREYCN